MNNIGDDDDDDQIVFLHYHFDQGNCFCASVCVCMYVQKSAFAQVVEKAPLLEMMLAIVNEKSYFPLAMY